MKSIIRLLGIFFLLSGVSLVCMASAPGNLGGKQDSRTQLFAHLASRLNKTRGSFSVPITSDSDSDEEEEDLNGSIHEPFQATQELKDLMDLDYEQFAQKVKAMPLAEVPDYLERLLGEKNISSFKDKLRFISNFLRDAIQENQIVKEHLESLHAFLSDPNTSAHRIPVVSSLFLVLDDACQMLKLDDSVEEVDMGGPPPPPPPPGPGAISMDDFFKSQAAKPKTVDTTAESSSAGNNKPKKQDEPVPGAGNMMAELAGRLKKRQVVSPEKREEIVGHSAPTLSTGLSAQQHAGTAPTNQIAHGAVFKKASKSGGKRPKKLPVKSKRVPAKRPIPKSPQKGGVAKQVGAKHPVKAGQVKAGQAPKPVAGKVASGSVSALRTRFEPTKSPGKMPQNSGTAPGVSSGSNVAPIPGANSGSGTPLSNGNSSGSSSAGNQVQSFQQIDKGSELSIKKIILATASFGLGAWAFKHYYWDRRHTDRYADTSLAA